MTTQNLTLILLRIWLGVRTLLTGIEKFAGTETVKTPLLDEFGDPDISGAMVEVKQKAYGFSHYHGIPESLYEKFAAEPLIPNWALALYSGTLGYILIALGLALLVGVYQRVVLFATGLLYTSLTVGLILINQSGGIAWLGIHIALIAFALHIAEKKSQAPEPKTS